MTPDLFSPLTEPAKVHLRNSAMTVQQVDDTKASAKKQSALIKALFNDNPNVPFSSEDVQDATGIIFLTSVRRELTNLCKAGFIVKCKDVTKPSRAGKNIVTWVRRV